MNSNLLLGIVLGVVLALIILDGRKYPGPVFAEIVIGFVVFGLVWFGARLLGGSI